jgi:hypothetical protein
MKKFKSMLKMHYMIKQIIIKINFIFIFNKMRDQISIKKSNDINLKSEGVHRCENSQRCSLRTEMCVNVVLMVLIMGCSFFYILFLNFPLPFLFIVIYFQSFGSRHG